MLKRAVVMLGITFLICACASAGTKVTQEQAAQFTRGKSTEAEVVTALGRPDSSTRLADGTKIDIYAHVSARPDAIDFVPFVGAVAGGASSNVEAVSFTFDAGGILTNYSATESATHVHSGL